MDASVSTEWPEPIQRVQELAELGLKSLPPRYVRPLQVTASAATVSPVPVVDLSAFSSGDDNLRRKCMQTLSSACREWGLFQVVNHGVPRELLASTMAVSRDFFSLPMEEKLKYANDPVSYQGYGSRLGVQKDIKLDWGDYFFHYLHPVSTRKDYQKWPRHPENYQEVVTQYGDQVFDLCKQLLTVFSSSLGLPEETLADFFGGKENLGASFRINLYPKCPEPQMTLGLSPHSDPGAFTVVQQNGVSGLQVNKDGAWYSVAPVEDALVIILGDQMEIVTNGVYKSADHRASVNGERERMSLVVFINPEGEKMIGPIDEMVKMSGGSKIFDEMSYNEYRQFIRKLGVQGKSILESRASKQSGGGPASFQTSAS
ncbi:jasmonate-induced oxygenase 2-like [Aristolochia californica]|uniref:jasmonate-induced oxygenase 2-like n=1 Tax=Aristolochia californica TaxID=171875 RepID=UPI0035E376BC